MNVVVCGSRDWTDIQAIYDRLLALPKGARIITGGARGADRYAAACARGLGMSVHEERPDWQAYGRAAGFKRNLAMLDMNPDLVIAFWKDGSTGTGHTVRTARERGIPVEILDGRR